MTPFQEFRLWTRRAPNGQRASAAVAGLIVLGLLVWAAIPIVNNNGTANALPVATGPVVVSATPPTQAPKPAHCTNPAGTVPGVTKTTVKIGVLIVNITGLATNKDLGILSATDQKAFYTKMIATLNAAGGVDCRQVVPQFFLANAADQSALQQTCLSVSQAGVFAVVDSGAYAQFPVVDCFAQHKVPYFGSYLLANSQMAQFYPYLFELNSLDVVYHDMVVGLKAQGFFDPANGFKKLGYIYNSCHPEIHTEMLSWLAAAGVKPSQIVSFNTGCTTAYTSSTVLEQAILKFKHAGVTNLTYTGIVGDFPSFTNLAQAQNFHPKYGLGDDSLIATSYGSVPPNPANVNGALAITASREGEEHDPNAVPSATTAKCNSILGVNVYKLPAAAGNICDAMWMFAAALNYAPTLSQTSLVAGLKAAKSVPFSYPQAPNDFAAGNHITYAGQYYKVDDYQASCKCWLTKDPTFHPSPL